MVPDTANNAIKQRLAAIEEEHSVRILYAAEAGSRAWSIASPDSDFDVRFIYCHSPDWYLSVRDRRDVIEYPVDENDFDVSGWDLRKALRLFLKSNPAMREWLDSPVTYVDAGDLAGPLRAIMRTDYDRQVLASHYLGTALSRWKREVAEAKVVNSKAYFYVVRPLACVAWLGARDDLPPIKFEVLVNGIGMPADTRAEVADLLIRKQAGNEDEGGPRFGLVDAWIADMLERAGEIRDALPAGNLKIDEIDTLFRQLIGQEST